MLHVRTERLSVKLNVPVSFSVKVASHFSSAHRLAGLVVKASASGAESPGFESRLRWDFSGSSHTSDFKIGTSLSPGVIGSALGLVGPVSVYCAWVRQKV